MHGKHQGVKTKKTVIAAAQQQYCKVQDTLDIHLQDTAVLLYNITATQQYWCKEQDILPDIDQQDTAVLLLYMAKTKRRQPPPRTASHRLAPPHLSTPGQLPREGALHDLVRPLHDVRRHVLPIGGGAEDGAQVPDAGERHVQGPGDRRRRERKDVHAGGQHLSPELSEVHGGSRFRRKHR